jgi:hypothetical protein
MLELIQFHLNKTTQIYISFSISLLLRLTCVFKVSPTEHSVLIKTVYSDLVIIHDIIIMIGIVVLIVITYA